MFLKGGSAAGSILINPVTALKKKLVAKLPPA